MLDFSDYVNPRRHRRKTPVVLALAGLAAAGTAAIAIAAQRDDAAAQAASPTGAARSYLEAAPTAARGVCIDATRQTEPAFPREVRQALASAVRTYAPAAGPLPTNVGQAAPVSQPASGLSLVVRQVVTNSLSTDLDRYSRLILLPPVRGLNQGRPSAAAADYAAAAAAWNRAYAAVAGDRDRAARAAAAGATAINSMPLADTPTTRSGVSACMSAVLATTPAAADRAFFISSDLEENVAPQLAGDFAGAPLTVVQSCQSGDAAYCDELFRKFEAQMRRLHVGPIRRIRPELADQAVRAWLNGDTR